MFILSPAKVAIFLLGAFFAAFLLSGFLSRPAHAESFLSRGSCQIAQWLGVECVTKAPANEQPATTNTTKTPPAGNQPSEQSAPKTVYPTLDPINISERALPPVSPMLNGPYTLVGVASGSRQVSMVSAGVYSDESRASVLGVAAAAPIQPSPQGWKFFGVSWYWLFVVPVSLLVTAYLMRNTFRRMKFGAKHKVLKF